MAPVEVLGASFAQEREMVEFEAWICGRESHPGAVVFCWVVFGGLFLKGQQMETGESLRDPKVVVFLLLLSV